MRFTQKQVQIIETLAKGADDGDFLDLNQLVEKLPYEVTKSSLKFSLRYLERRGLVESFYERRRGAKRRVIRLTPAALQGYDVTTEQFDIIVEGD